MIKTISFFFLTFPLLLFMRCSGGGHEVINQQTCEDTLATDIVVIDSVSYDGLKFYYPPIASIGLVVGDEPDTSNFYISFCCAAAYNHKSIYQHKGPAEHIHVAGNHIDGGEPHRGYPDDTINTGGFVAYPFPYPEDCQWKIVDRQEFAQRVSSETKPCTAFQQELLILDGKIQRFNRPDRPENYRALCNFKGRLCVVDGTQKQPLSSFVDLLCNADIEDALYLDMGDWKYSWYRDYPEDIDSEWGAAKIIYPKPEKGGYYGSNWLVFYLVN